MPEPGLDLLFPLQILARNSVNENPEQEGDEWCKIVSLGFTTCSQIPEVQSHKEPWQLSRAESQ